jgi:hypothetical protein
VKILSIKENRLMKKVQALALSLLVVGAACKQKPAGAEAYPVRIETVDGLRTVHNPDFPRDGKSTPSLFEELAIGETEGAEEYLFNRPQWIRVDGAGRIYVMDWGDVCIKVFEPDGRHLRTVGSKGQGPGEFDIPAWFDLAPDGRIVIMDGRNHRVTVWDGEGRHVGDFRVGGFHSGMACDPSGRVYFQNQTAGKQMETLSESYQAVPYTTTVWRSDLEGRTREKIGDFEGEVRGMRRTGEAGMISVGSPYTNLWTVDRSGRFVVGYNARYDFTVYGPDLRPEFRFLRDYVPFKSPSYRGEAWQNEFHPAVERFFILTDEEGSFWLERAIPPTLKEPEEPGGEMEWISPPDHIYDVFDKEGIYTRELTFPFRISAIRGGKFYAMVRDEDGTVSIKRFRTGP